MLARLQNLFKQVGAFLKRQDVFVISLIIVVGVTSFGLGRLSLQDETITPSAVITEAFDTTDTENTVSGSATTEEGSSTIDPSTEKAFVGSKNSDKYHFPWCPGALRIKEENKVWFSSREEAEALGYTPAGNCKGL